MDSEFWTSRLAAAKRQFTLQHQHQHHNHNHTSHLDRLTMDDLEVEEEVRTDFSCPYCYEDFDISSICSHLEDEHSCETRVTVCPVCSIKVASDMLNHITLQHGHLFKMQRRRRLRRVAIPNSQVLSLLGRDLREAHLQVLLGGGGGGYRQSNVPASSNAVSDPLISSLVMNFSSSEAEEISKSMASAVDDSSTKSVDSHPQHIWKSSFDPSLSHEEREKKIKQAAGRAVFMQDLLVSTLLAEE